MMNFTNAQLIVLTYTSILMLVLPGCAEWIYEWVQGRKSSGVSPHVEIKSISEGEIDHPHAA